MPNKFNIHRTQLASFLKNDADLIRRFEELFDDVGDKFPENIEEIEALINSLSSGTYGSIASLEGSLNRLTSALESIPSVVKDEEDSDDLKPVTLFEEGVKELNDLKDVSYVNPLNGQALVYDLASKQFTTAITTSGKIVAITGITEDANGVITNLQTTTLTITNGLITGITP